MVCPMMSPESDGKTFHIIVIWIVNWISKPQRLLWIIRRGLFERLASGTLMCDPMADDLSKECTATQTSHDESCSLDDWLSQCQNVVCIHVIIRVYHWGWQEQRLPQMFAGLVGHHGCWISSPFMIKDIWVQLPKSAKTRVSISCLRNNPSWTYMNFKSSLICLGLTKQNFNIATSLIDIVPMDHAKADLRDPISTPNWGAQTGAAFSVNATGSIKANPKVVLDVLLNTSEWPRWNNFVPHVSIINASGSSEDVQRLSPGTLFKEHVDMAGRGRSTIVKMKLLMTVCEEIKESSRDGYRVVWLGKGYPDWLLRSERVHEIFQTNGTGETTYHVYETFSGPLAWAVKVLFGKTLVKRFQQWNGELKCFAERDWLCVWSRSVSSNVYDVFKTFEAQLDKTMLTWSSLDEHVRVIEANPPLCQDEVSFSNAGADLLHHIESHFRHLLICFRVHTSGKEFSIAFCTVPRS